MADRATRVSLAGAGASGVCRQARSLITINALSTSRAAVQRELETSLQQSAEFIFKAQLVKEKAAVLRPPCTPVADAASLGRVAGRSGAPVV